MRGWVRRGIEKGSLTTRFPGDKPETVSPWVSELARVAPGNADCPTDAITGDTVNRFRCISCGRCSPFFAPSGNLNLPDTKVQYALFKRSMKLYLIDTGSCGGCNSEVQQLWNPVYDLSRLGIFFTNTPRHADALLVVGVLTEGMEKPLLDAYNAIPEPKLVFAVGACAASGGILGRSISSLLECQIIVPGCPPDPFAIIDAIQKSRGVE